jgi:hypothetical protein
MLEEERGSEPTCAKLIGDGADRAAVELFETSRPRTGVGVDRRDIRPLGVLCCCQHRSTLTEKRDRQGTSMNGSRRDLMAAKQARTLSQSNKNRRDRQSRMSVLFDFGWACISCMCEPTPTASTTVSLFLGGFIAIRSMSSPHPGCTSLRAVFPTSRVLSGILCNLSTLYFRPLRRLLTLQHRPIVPVEVWVRACRTRVHVRLEHMFLRQFMVRVKLC